MTTTTPLRYLEPNGFTQKVFNPLVAWLTRRGLSVWGSRVLAVKGRVSGEWREVPVNLLRIDGIDYLVAPRGTTQWVRNLRVAGHGRLRVGRRVQDFVGVELADAEKPEILRAYLRRWKWEIGQFFEGVGPDAPDDVMALATTRHPVFRISYPG
jgi:hypothetical protein